MPSRIVQHSLSAIFVAVIPDPNTFPVFQESWIVPKFVLSTFHSHTRSLGVSIFGFRRKRRLSECVASIRACLRGRQRSKVCHSHDVWETPSGQP